MAELKGFRSISLFIPNFSPSLLLGRSSLLNATTVSFFSSQATICKTQRKWLIFMAGCGYLHSILPLVLFALANTPHLLLFLLHHHHHHLHHLGHFALIYYTLNPYIVPPWNQNVFRRRPPHAPPSLRTLPPIAPCTLLRRFKHRYYLERNLATSTEYILSTRGALTREFFTTFGNVRTWELLR